MNGLQALMPQGQQQERADAAMGIASMSLEGANLPPETEYATEVQRAKNILAAADAQLAMQKGQPQQPPQVVPRMRQEVEQRLRPQPMQGGLVDMLRSLRGGMQQRGRQAAMAGRMPPAQVMPQMQGQMPQRPAPQQMQRPPMGGIAGIPAPNMARPQMAAQGGVVGFAAGGDPEIEQYIQLDEQFRKYKAEGDMVSAANVKSEMDLMEANNPNLKAEAMQQATRDAGFDPEVELNLTPKVNKPGGKGKDGKPIKRFAGPDGSMVSSLPADATPEQMEAFYTGQAMPPRPQEGATDVEQLVLDEALKQLRRDAGAEGRAAGERVEELTALTEERAQLQQAQDALREAMGARLTPEQERRRMRRATFRGMSEGLGGASRRIGEEEAAIQAERVGIAQTSVADYQKVVDSLEARGMSRAEAERTVQAQVQNDIRQGLSTAQSITQQLRQSETTRRGQDIQLAVAEKYAARNRQPTNESEYVEDYLQAARDAGDPRTDAQIRVEAVESYKSFPSQYSLSGRELTARMALYDSAQDFATAEIDRLTSGMGRLSPEGRAYAEMTPDQQLRYRQNLVDMYQRGAPDVGQQTGGSNNNLPIITTQEQFDALPSGAEYIEDGVTYRKP
jgi:hypothetical protein